MDELEGTKLMLKRCQELWKEDVIGKYPDGGSYWKFSTRFKTWQEVREFKDLIRELTNRLGAKMK